jgi:hypothetical protein
MATTFGSRSRTACAVIRNSGRTAIRESQHPSSSAPSVRRAYSRALAPGAFVKLCVKHRRRFQKMHADVGTLMEIRWQAEDTLEESGQRPAVTYSGDDEDLPF